jgi:predicted Zn-dependent peptidase
VNLKENNFWLSALDGMYYYNQNPEEILDRITYINALKAADIEHAAKTFFTRENVAKFVLNPEKK